MTQCRKLFAMFLALGLCAFLVACGSSAGSAGGGSAQAEAPAEENSEEKQETAPETEANETADTTSESSEDAVDTVYVGILAWNIGATDSLEFWQAVKDDLSEKYADQIGEVFQQDVHEDAAFLLEVLKNMTVMWEGEKMAFIIVNEEYGFTDEDLMETLQYAEEAGVMIGVDHVIEGAPETTFVYDASDPAGCAELIMENALK